jgi:putative heme-binding domain-containing protein
MRLNTTLSCAVFFGLGVLMAQDHPGTQADIEDGGRLYRTACQGCHGPDGDKIAGIDFGRNQFKTASSDDQIIQVIRNGVPNTEMKAAANNVAGQAGMIVAYLRSMVNDPARKSALSGDAGRGKSLFDGKGACGTCHRVNGNGSRFGPDLSEIGNTRRSAELERSLVDPDAEITPANRSYRVITKDGQTVIGRLLSLDTFTVQMIDQKEQLRSFVKANVRSYGFVEKSPMPSYKDKLSSQEMADMLAYLSSLKGSL